MSIDYKLMLASKVPLDAVLDVVEAVPGFSRVDHGLEADDMFVTTALAASLESEMVEEEIGFRPYAKCSFRFIKNRDPVRARERLIECGAALLARFPGDAIFLFNGEVPILLRRSGQLEINLIPGFWTQHMLSALGHPPQRTMPPL